MQNNLVSYMGVSSTVSFVTLEYGRETSAPGLHSNRKNRSRSTSFDKCLLLLKFYCVPLWIGGIFHSVGWKFQNVGRIFLKRYAPCVLASSQFFYQAEKSGKAARRNRAA